MDRLTTSDADQAYLPTADSNHRDREFILMNKIAHGGSYPGRDDDLAAMITSGNIRKAAALPSSGKQESGVPPRASPVAPQEIAVPATATSKGVAPLDSTTQEVDAPPVAPLAPMPQEEPLVSLVDAPSCVGDIPAVWTGAKTAQEATEMEVIDLPDANLAEAIAEAESRDADHDDARAPRKRRATTHDDSDTHSSTSDSARPRKKAPRASRAAAAAAGRAGASAAKAPHPTRTQQPTATVAASRQPDEDGFASPARRACHPCRSATDCHRHSAAAAATSPRCATAAAGHCHPAAVNATREAPVNRPCGGGRPSDIRRLLCTRSSS
ncbi:translation initiation factor IF-2-like [Schistocerca americana]|uniref:translation initiation factor IF-2-like n=1 Tax=Schistocerca americana TaxID=7009 RepID=UPI001F5001D0|nr:translation initiation factor IF-2-like [Schistocerca americana]